MPVKQVELPLIGTVKLYKRRGSRSIRLSLDHSGEIRVTLPYYVSYRAGLYFVRAKADWIMTQRQQTIQLLKPGAKIGKAHHLAFIASPLSRRLATRIQGSVVQVTHPETLNWQSASVQTAAKQASARALRQEANSLLPQRLEILAHQMGFHYRKVTCKQLKSRWGSCNENDDIVLNIYLIQLPWELIDYVLVHELTHTKIMHHGPKFWAELASHLPNAKQLRKAIRVYRPILAP